MNDIYYYFLLFNSHFVVARETETSAEDISADIGTGSSDIGVCSSPAISFGNYKGVISIDRLHVHGLPDRSGFGIDGCQGIEDLLGGGFAGLGFVEVVAFAADHGGHGFFVDDEAAEPEVWAAFFAVPGVHFDWEVGEAFFVALVDRAFLSDVLVKVGELAADDSGDDVGHAVVVADLFVLVPGSGFAALGGPFADFIGVSFIICQEHAAGAAGDDLVAVEGDRVEAA